MIKDRPAGLLAIPEYRRLPSLPFAVDLNMVPELVRAGLGPLGGIQPVTGAMAKAAGGPMFDRPSPGEIDLFRAAGTNFQLVSVVLSLAAVAVRDGTTYGVPYSLSLIPVSKRGKVHTTTIDFIEKVDIGGYLRKTQPCYWGYNPFSGAWGLYAPLGMYGSDLPDGFVDELGLVVGQYFLATEYDAQDILTTPIGFTNPRAEEKYQLRHQKLLFTPFKKVEARRIWGAESPIELFLLQALLLRGLSPMLQAIFYEDGSVHSSLYHLWREVEFRAIPGMITEADLYFPDQKIAVFCDSTTFHRGVKNREKDQRVSDRLMAIGISSVRMPGKVIVDNIEEAADMVCKAVGA